jgi:ABC-type molybdate transport system ATPase subunit
VHVTHNLREVEARADHLVVLNEGRVTTEGLGA